MASPANPTIFFVHRGNILPALAPTFIPQNHDCVVCSRLLFSTGERVVKVRECAHGLHQSCLQRSFRIRTSDNGGNERRVCPACRNTGISPPIGLIDPLSFTDTRLDDGGQGLSIKKAQKLVQYLLWSSASNMEDNVYLVLNKLRTDLLPGVPENRRLSTIRESGLVQACMSIMKENPQDGNMLLEAMQVIQDCLGNHDFECIPQSSIEIARENAEGVLEILTGTTALNMGERFTDYSLYLIEVLTGDLSDPDQSEPRLTEESIDCFNRIIPGILNTMKQHPGGRNAQESGVYLLYYLAVRKTCCLETIIESGGLSVLFEVITKYFPRVEPGHTAREILESLLRRDLRLGSS